jgi:hypothetical protein
MQQLRLVRCVSGRVPMSMVYSLGCGEIYLKHGTSSIRFSRLLAAQQSLDSLSGCLLAGAKHSTTACRKNSCETRNSQFVMQREFGQTFYFDLFLGAPSYFHSATSGNFWVKSRWWLRTLPFRIRHYWPRRLRMPTKKRVDRAIMRLWKANHLIRATGAVGYYRLKP